MQLISASKASDRSRDYNAYYLILPFSPSIRLLGTHPQSKFIPCEPADVNIKTCREVSQLLTPRTSIKTKIFPEKLKARLGLVCTYTRKSFYLLSLVLLDYFESMTIFTSHTDGVLHQAPSTVTSLGGVFLSEQHPTMPHPSVNPTRNIHCQTGFYYLLSLCIHTPCSSPSRTHTLDLPGLSWGPNVLQQALLSHPRKNGLRPSTAEF